MINRLYLARIIDFSDRDKTWLERHLSKRILDKTLTVRNQRIKDASFTAELLLMHVLRFELQLLPASDDRFVIPEISEGQKGKPYFPAYPKVCFNMSHSGDYVLCGVGGSPLGVDLQKTGSGREDIAKRFYTDDERDYILNSDNPKRAFFDIWALKESYIKYTGEGLAAGLDSFSVCSGMDFELDKEHNHEGLLHLFHTFFIDENDEEYAAGACYTGTIDKKLRMIKKISF